MTETDVLIVGAGPVGLELAVALKREGVDYTHVEAGQVGSTFLWWAPQTRFFSSPERISIAGVPLITPDQGKATREEYLAYLRGIVLQFDLDVRTYERVVDARRDGDGSFIVTTRASRHGVGGPEELALKLAGARGGDRPGACTAENPDRPGACITEYRARRVVLTIGDMHLPRMLGIDREELPHVSHFFEGPHAYFRKRVLIVGGKNSAAEAALRCWRAGAHVAVSYRRDRFDEKRVKYWIRPELEWLIRHGRVGFLPNTAPGLITPEAVHLTPTDAEGSPVRTGGEPVEVDPWTRGAMVDRARGRPTLVRPDFVLLLTGYVQDPSLFGTFGVTVDGPGRVPRHERLTMETDSPGVYVAGTAAAGTQIGGVKVFIENAHGHVDRIVSAVLGRRPPADEAELAREHEELPEA